MTDAEKDSSNRRLPASLLRLARLLVVMGLAAVATLRAGGVAAGHTSQTPTLMSAAAEAGNSSTGLSVGPITFSIDPVAGSGVSGVATLTDEGGETLVSLELTGLTPDASYAGRLLAGTCEQPSASFTDLPVLQAAGGDATASGPVRFRGTEEVALSDLSDGDHVIIITLAGAAVACGSIPALQKPEETTTHDLPGVAAIVHAVEERDADALAALVRYTLMECIATPQGIPAPPLCSPAGVPSGSLVEALPALLCEGEYFVKSVVPQFLRQQLERGELVFIGVLNTTGEPYSFPLEVPAAGEWPAPEYAVIFRATAARLDLGFHVAGGQIVALRSFGGEFGICGAPLPPPDDPAWLVQPQP